MTWNPVTGCTKVSQGCKYCYAERLAKRLQLMGVKRYRNGFQVTLHEDITKLPIKWKKPSIIFVNSMSDLFQEEVPLDFIKSVFDTMERTPHHVYQILTKRSKRLKEVANELPWPFNVWMGVSVEDARVLHRIFDLQEIPSKVRFLSCEPLIGPLENLPLKGIDWVIVGGESGPKSRPMKEDWAQSILKQCRKANVAFFFKQWGGIRKDLAGRKLNGQTYDEIPLHKHQLKTQFALFSEQNSKQ